MAATSAAFAATTGSAVVAATARKDASRLSSSNSFRSTSMVQFSPLRPKRVNGVVAARAAGSDSKASHSRDVIVSIIAAGAVLGFSVSDVDAAFANPIAAAKSKATGAVESAKNAVPSLPSAPSLPSLPSLPSAPAPGDAAEGIMKGGENIASGLRDRIDGVFGKNRPGPLSRNSVSSSNGGTGSALGDAKKRVSNFGKNPFAETIAKGSEKTANNIATASPKPNAQRVDEATKKVGQIGADVQQKGTDAINEGKSFVGGGAQGVVPSLPNLFPKLPETPELPTPDTGKLEDLKSGVQSKAEEAKTAAGSVFNR